MKFNHSFKNNQVKPEVASIPVTEIYYVKSGPDAGRIKTRPYMVAGEQLTVNKQCIDTLKGWEMPPYYTIDTREVDGKSNKSRQKRLKKSKLLFRAFCDANDLIPYGSGLKGEKGKIKFYAEKAENVIKRYGNLATDIVAYAGKGKTDIKYGAVYRMAVMSYEVLVNRLILAGYYPEGTDPGFDGSSFIREECLPKTLGCQHIQFVGVPNDDIYPSPLAKGAFDVLSKEMMDKVVGPEYAGVLIINDQIKINHDLAKSGDWLIGFTFNTKRVNYPISIQWEFTQFFKWMGNKNKLVFFLDKLAAEIDRVESILSGDRSGLLKYIDADIQDKVSRGLEVEVETSLYNVLLSNLPIGLEWTQKRLKEYVASEIGKVIKTVGIYANGRTLYTDDYWSQYSPNYLSKEATRLLGGDNDFDQFGEFVNTATKKRLIFRYPIVAGPVIIDIPDYIIENNLIKDHHPELVDLFEEIGYRINFSRASIKEGATKINEPGRYARLIASDMVGEAQTGYATIQQHKFCAMYGKYGDKIYLDLAESMCAIIEGGIMKFKFHNIKSPNNYSLMKEIDWEQINKGVPMAYRNWNPRRVEDFYDSKTKKPIDFGDNDIYSYLLSSGIAAAAEYVLEAQFGEKKHCRQIMVPMDKLMNENINNRFMDEVEDALTYFNGYVHKLNKLKEEGMDEEEFKAALVARIAGVKAIGRTMSTGQLQVAIQHAWSKASDRSSGSFGIHIANERAVEVFGSYNGEDIIVSQQKNKDFQILVYTKGSKCIQDAKLSEGMKVSFTNDNKNIVMVGASINLNVNESKMISITEGNSPAYGLNLFGDDFIVKRVEEYETAKGTVSKKTARLTISR